MPLILVGRSVPPPGPDPDPDPELPPTTHWVTADATGSGDGSQASPFTLLQACAAAQPDWVVEIGPGVHIGPNRGSRFEPTFRIAAQGSEEHPIIFFARNYAALNESGRTILQHTGTVQGSGCPVLGLSTGHRWYGPYINEDNAPSTPDTGPVVISGQHTRLGYAKILRGTESWPQSENNHAAIRYEGVACRHHIVHDCWIEGYNGVGASGSQQAIQLFSVNNNPAETTGLVTVENCYFYDNQFALTVKGAGAARPINGGIIFRRNIVRTTSRGNSGGVAFMDTSAELGRNQVYQNIFVGGNAAVRTMNQAGHPVTDIDIINNTAINLAPEGDDFYGFHSDRYEMDIGSGWRIHNNVNVGTAVPFFRSPFGVDSDAAVTSRSHNISQSSTWGYVEGLGGGVQTLAQWVSRGKDGNSLVANAMLQSTTWGNANLGKLQAGSPALNSGVDILNLLGNGTSASIHRGAFILPDQTDVIGIRPLA